MKNEIKEVQAIKDSKNGWIVEQLEKITGYKPWFIKEQLGISLVDVSTLSPQEIKEAVGMLGDDIDDATTELSLAATIAAAETADQDTLWSMLEKVSFYNSRVRYVILKKFKEGADSLITLLPLLKILCYEEITCFEKEELCTEVLTLCTQYATLEQTNEITNTLRTNQRVRENAAQAQLIAEAQLKHLNSLEDYEKLKKVDTFAAAHNWVAVRMLLIKLKALIEKTST